MVACSSYVYLREGAEVSRWNELDSGDEYGSTRPGSS